MSGEIALDGVRALVIGSTQILKRDRILFTTTKMRSLLR